MRRTNFLIALGVSVFLILGAQAGSASEFTLDIQPQPLRDALSEFGRQSGLQVVFVYTDIDESIISTQLTGTFSAQAALRQLLANTSLAFEFINPRTVAIRSAASAASSAGFPQNPEPAKAPDAKGSIQLVQADMAQQTPAESSKEPPETSEKKVQEIIVTATKREERLSDVPASITAITAEEIERRRLVGAGDYLRGIPGANQVEGVSGQSIVIRDIEANTIFQGFRASATTATYFGETPTTDSAGMISSNVDIKLVDIERVEVLRGPQGTAFGSSSMGGAIRTIPVAPKLDSLEAKVATGYSVTSGNGDDNYNVQAVGNVPLIADKLAIRAVAYMFSDSGYYRNRPTSNAAFQSTFVVPFGAQDFIADEEEVGAYHVKGGRIAALLQATEDLRLTFTYMKQDTETDGWGLSTNGDYEQALPLVAPEHAVRGQRGGVLDTSIEIANAVLEYDLGWADLLATYSHIDGGSMFSQAYPVVGINWAVSAVRPPTFQGEVGEIRLATKFEGPWNFLGGVYLESTDDTYPVDLYWFADPARNFLAPGQRLLLDYLEQRDLEQRAAFGEISWEFLPGLTLTGGVRTYEYERSFRIDQSGFFAGGNPPPAQQHLKSSGSNFRANLSYKPVDDMLLYAGWAQGFRFGRPQLGLPAALCDKDGDGFVDGTDVTIASTTQIDSDDVDSYEIGGKFAMLERRVTLDAAAFRMEWSGLPVAVIYPSACLSGFTANAGSALSEGIELQGAFQVTDAVRLDVGGSWVHARLTEDVPAQGFLSGDRLPGSPKVNANVGVQFDFPIGSYAASVRADSIYVGPFYGDVAQSPNTRSGDYVKLDAAARVQIGNLNVDLYAHNLTDEDAFTFRGAYSFTGALYGYQMRPRTFGVQLGYRFE